MSLISVQESRKVRNVGNFLIDEHVSLNEFKNKYLLYLLLFHLYEIFVPGIAAVLRWDYFQSNVYCRVYGIL